jgi:opacity protein-like surface antigen
MKKIFVISVFLFIISIPISLNAQELRLGLKIDPQVTWFTSHDDYHRVDKNVWGINPGLIVDYFFAENYAFSTGISICRVGGGMRYNETLVLKLNDRQEEIEAGSFLTYKNEYVEIPFALKLTSREFGYFTVYGKAGLTSRLNIKSKVSNEINTIEDYNAIDEIRAFELGYHFGGGIQYSLGGNTAIMGGITYINGFTDVTETKGKITQNTVTINLGFLF